MLKGKIWQILEKHNYFCLKFGEKRLFSTTNCALHMRIPQGIAINTLNR